MKAALALVFVSFLSLASPTPKSADSEIKQGDILLSVNGIKVTDPTKGLQAFQALNDSKRAVIRVMRNGKEKTFVRVAKAKQQPRKPPRP